MLRWPIIHLWLILALLVGNGLSALAFAAGEAPEQSSTPGGIAEVPLASVTLDGIVLFRVRGVSAYPAATRAAAIIARIKDAAADSDVSVDSVRIEESEEASTIMAGSMPIVRIYGFDAELEGVDRQTLAKAYRYSIAEAIKAWRHDRDPSVIKRRILYALGATLGIILALWVGQRIFRRLRTVLKAKVRPKVQDVRIQKFRLVRGDQLIRGLTWLLGLLWGTLIVVGAYLYLQGVLSLFPWTRGFANRLFTLLLNPLRTIGKSLLEAIPDLVFLLVLFFITRYVLKLVRLFFTTVAEGKVALAGFEAEWAWPTYRLVRVMLIAFSLVIAYPYIPGSESGAFKGISIFIGVLFSLGSSSIIGNLIAGYTMTYRRAFKVGDRIKVGEHIGDVVKVRLLVTHLCTPKNEEVVIPNSVILGGEIVNYSTLAGQDGLILHTTIGIGYETPWRQVEAMLLEAAARTPRLLREPPPFVLQKVLDDFCVTYEVNAYCSDPKEMNRLYTELHRNILDVFNEYGVQIMTPSYEGDPGKPKVVPKDQWYAAPARPPEEARETKIAQ